MTPRRILFGIAVLWVSLFVSTTDAPARNRPGSQPGGNNFTDKEQLRTTSKQLGARVHSINLSKREIQRVIKAAVKACSCACPTANLSWSSCFEGCLKSWGVSATSAAACAAACANNPVGCAICAGIHEWIVLGCAQYCVWKGVIAAEESSVSNRPVRPLRARVTYPAKLTNSGGGGS